jgi:hypothetical protein
MYDRHHDQRDRQYQVKDLDILQVVGQTVDRALGQQFVQGHIERATHWQNHQSGCDINDRHSASGHA